MYASWSRRESWSSVASCEHLGDRIHNGYRTTVLTSKRSNSKQVNTTTSPDKKTKSER